MTYAMQPERISRERFLIMFECLCGSVTQKSSAGSQQSKVQHDLALPGVLQEKCSVCRAVRGTASGLQDGKGNSEALPLENLQSCRSSHLLFWKCVGIDCIQVFNEIWLRRYRTKNCFQVTPRRFIYTKRLIFSICHLCWIYKTLCKHSYSQALLFS